MTKKQAQFNEMAEAVKRLRKAKVKLAAIRAQQKVANSTAKKSSKRVMHGTLQTAKGSRREFLIKAFLAKGSITLDEIKSMKEIQNPNAKGFFGSKTMKYLVETGVAEKTGKGRWVLANGFTGTQLLSTGSVRLNRIYQ